MAFQEAFKISCFFASIFFGFWLRLGLQLGAILGAKTAQNPKKWVQKKVGVLPKSGSEYDVATELRSRAFCHRFWGCQASIFEDFGVVFRFSWLTLGMFFSMFGHVGSICFKEVSDIRPYVSLSSERGIRASPSSYLPRESKNLPRTKPKTKSLQNLTRNIRPQSLVLQNSFSYRKPLCSKRWAAVLRERVAIK